MRICKSAAALVVIAAVMLVGATGAMAITNGQPDGTNHPYVGLMVALDEVEPSRLVFRTVCKWLYGQPREDVKRVPEPALLQRAASGRLWNLPYHGNCKPI